MASINPCISKYYHLKIVKKEVIVSAIPMRQQVLPLSNLDLLIPPVSVHVYFCYDNPSPRTFASALFHLKTSLSRVLVSYYVFAGRLMTDSIGVAEVQCNGKGVWLTQAYAATSISQLNLYNPDESVQGKLVPLLSEHFQEDGIPIFAVQVTEFSCGGLLVGCTFDHRVAHAYSANMFFMSWEKRCRNESSVSPNPSITRSILCPRDPHAYSCAQIENLYVRHIAQESSQDNPHPTCLASRIYYLDEKNIMGLQLNANKNGSKYTKLEAFSAYLWKLLICTQNVEDTVNCKIGIAVDGRPCLRNIGVSPHYFGNVISLPFAETHAHCVKTKSLCWSAGLIHDAIQSAANEEHFQSLIDFVEITKPTPVLAKIYCGGDEVESSGPAVMVSSGLRFPLYEVDYGWGKPTFASYHFPWGGEAGYVMPTHSPAGDGSLVVYMNLPLKHFNTIEADPSSILLPLKQHFLQLPRKDVLAT